MKTETEKSNFEENEIPQSLHGNIYEQKDYKRMEHLFELEKAVYDTFSDISALRSNSAPIPIAQASEALRRKCVPLLLFLEPLMKQKKKTLGIDFWDGEEIYLGCLDIPDVVVYCNTDVRDIYGLGRIVDLPERITYATRQQSSSLGYSGKVETNYTDTVIPYDVMLNCFREVRRFLQKTQLNLHVDDKLPIVLRVPNVNEDEF